jgi:hypothetical protein
MFRELAVAAVLVALAAGSVAYGADFNSWSTSGDADDRPTEEVGLYDSPGDDTFFDVFMEMPIIDDGDAGFAPSSRRVIDNGEPGFTASIINLLDLLWFDIDR